MKAAGAALAFLSCLLNAQGAGANPRDAHAPLVIVTEQGKNDSEDAAFFSSARALAAEIGIVVTTEEVPSFLEARDALLAKTQGQRKPFLGAWVLREDNQRTLHLFDPGTGQLRTRSIHAGASPTANAEALALILRAELLAYLEEPPPAPPAPPPPPLPPAPPPPPPPPAPDPRWGVTGAYLLGTFLSGQGVRQGARLGLIYMGPRLSVALAYSLFPGQEVTGLDTAITVRRHPVDLALGYATPEQQRLRWIAEGFVSGDWISRRTFFARAPLSSHPDAGSFLVSLGARGRQELRIFRHLALYLGLGADILLNPVAFQSDKGSRIETVARLSRVRFSAELGVRIAAF